MQMKLSNFKPLNLYTCFLGILFPWIVIIAFASSPATVIIFISVFIGMFFFGKVLIDSIPADFTDSDRWLLALPAGYMTVSGLTALLLKLSVSPVTVFWITAILMAYSTVLQFFQKKLYNYPNIHGLWLLVPLSLIISLVYYLPGAIRDAVFLPDGSFNWMYVDTQYFYAIASSVKSSSGVPLLPGTSMVEMNYHFGPYSIAGIISAALDVPVGDALVRISRPIAELSLIFSTYTTGRYVVRDTGKQSLAGILSVAGLFFYGSTASFLSNLSLADGNILSELPRLTYNNGGIFSHLFLGHSQVHGMNALLVVILILNAKLQTRDIKYLNPDISLLAPAIIFPSSILLGFASLGLYILLIAWFGRFYKCSYLNIALAIGAAIFSAWLMGYLNTLSSGELVQFSPMQALPGKLFSCFVWFFVGLGFRLYVLTQISNPFKDAISASIVVLLAGFIATGLFIPEFDSRYGFLYAQGILSVIAFAWLSTVLFSIINRNWSGIFQDVQTLLRLVMFSSIVFLIISSVIYFVSTNTAYLLLNYDYILSISRTIKYSLILVSLSCSCYVFIIRSHNMKRVVATAIVIVYSLGFTAWVTDFKAYALDSSSIKNVTITVKEFQGLSILKSISSKSDLIATNKHHIYIDVSRSFAYGALSQRPVLLEGWDYSILSRSINFKHILSDNELIFDSSNADLVKFIIDKYKIKYLIAKPGTDLKIAANMPDWLKKIPGTGSLNIYQVVEKVVVTPSVLHVGSDFSDLMTVPALTVL